ncbi:MAG: hypothetical protein M1828_002072 [Chrysothrix sp. TS-e1954]|nr:MAG: hypothetical protein M1828_002072 [Chrysothrix sp. TS-e1954]
MASGSVWNPDNIRDVAEAIGISSLSPEVLSHLTRDVEFRIAQVLEEALKFMRHAKRTTLFTQDVSQALRVLDVEPLYGYDSTRPLKFGEAPTLNGTLYYIDDEEVDFEKLINAPLPKVPREICFTAHWLAVEGVQPSIPQNPTPADSSRSNTELLPKGPGANAHLAATSGADNLAVKPLVKHVLSRELQLYFERVCAAILDESNDEYRAAALNSIRTDPGLHQLVPYFVHWVAEKVTHSLKSLFVLEHMLLLVSALLDNHHLHVAPYVAALVPPVLTCLVGKRLGPSAAAVNGAQTNGDSSSKLPAHYHVRSLAASLLQSLIRPTYAEATPSLKPRLARTLLKHLLASTPQPLGVFFGAILGLRNVAGAEGVRVLLLPNMAALEDVLNDAMQDPDLTQKVEIATVVEAVVGGLEMIELEQGGRVAEDSMDEDMDRTKLNEKLGSVIGKRVYEISRPGLAKIALEQDPSL